MSRVNSIDIQILNFIQTFLHGYKIFCKRAKVRFRIKLLKKSLCNWKAHISIDNHIYIPFVNSNLCFPI